MERVWKINWLLIILGLFKQKYISLCIIRPNINLVLGGLIFYMHFVIFQINGLHSLPRLVIFTSEDAHYSIQKMASFLGIGSKNVYLVKTEKNGKMSMSHLREEIKRAKSEGAEPFMVSATAGTTVLGAFDPINEIADICQEHNLWLHVDAAWGGGALMSKKFRYLLNGIER